MGKLKPQELSFADAAPYKTSASITCPAPASAVFNVLKDNEKWPEWVKAGVTSVKTTSSPGHGLGSTRRVTFFGFASVSEKFVGWEEPTLWAFTGTSFTPKVFTKLVERFQIEPIDDRSCRIIYTIGADFPFLMKLISGRFLRFFTGAANAALQRLSNEAVRRYS